MLSVPAGRSGSTRYRTSELEGEETLVQAVGDVDLSLLEQRVRNGMAAAEAGSGS